MDDDMDHLLATMDAGEDVNAEGIPPLTEARLRRITGFDDLSKVVEAELVVDAETATVDLLGHALPMVTDLHLAGSRVPSFRAFGTRLVHLKRLWLGRSGVKDLSGAQFMHQLSELYLPFNAVSDVSPLAGLLNLEVLDLDSNLVATVADAAVLHSLSELKALSLCDNPAAVGDGTAEYVGSYRGNLLAALLPGTALEVLDDIPVTDEERAEFGASDEEDDAADANGEPVPRKAARGNPKAPTQPAETDASKLREAAEIAREKRMLAEGIRATQGVGVDAIVQEEHRSLCSRQSSSAAGTRRAATGGDQRRRDSVGGVGTGGRAGLASAPTLSSPSKADRVVVSKARVSPPPPPPPAAAAGGGGLARETSAGTVEQLAGSRKVFSGNITRSLRQTKAVGSGATMRALDGDRSMSTTPPAAAGLASSSSFAGGGGSISDPPMDDDIVDETDDAVERRRAAAEADALVQRSLLEEERVMTAGAETRRQRQERLARGEGADDDSNDDEDDIATARKRFLTPQDENVPELANWKARMNAHLASTAAAAATATTGGDTTPAQPTESSSSIGTGLHDGMSDAEVLYAVKTFKTTTAQAFKDDVVREAMGGGAGGAVAGGDAAAGYEALGLDDLGEGQDNNGIYDDVL